MLELAPFKLGDLKKVAPIIDRINTRGDGIADFERTIDAVLDFATVISFSAIKADIECDADWFAEHVGFSDQAAIMIAFRDLLKDSGLAPKGEAPAPPRPRKAKAGASASA